MLENNFKFQFKKRNESLEIYKNKKFLNTYNYYFEKILMKVIILASFSGLGTRLAEYTKTVPKPMVKVAGYPILIHIYETLLKIRI